MGTCTALANRINLTRSRNGDTAQRAIAENEMLTVTFRGAAMTWTHHVSVPRTTVIGRLVNIPAHLQSFQVILLLMSELTL